VKPLRTAAALLAISALLSPVLVACSSDDGTGDSGVVINEVRSDGGDAGDWVELANTGDQAVDVSGWGLADDDHDPLTLPDDSIIEAGGYLVVNTEPDFGLGSEDSVTLTDTEDVEIDSTSWDEDAATSWGRVPDTSGDFSETDAATPGLTNTVESWPSDPLPIEDIDMPDDFDTEDMSGVDLAEDGTAYVVNNATGTLYVLTPTDTGYDVTDSYQLRYPDGSGEPDAEGVTVGPDGALYVATERDGEGDEVSRPSVLRYELPDGDADELTATDEWNLADFTGDLDANSGPESISWISDASSPATFAVGIEATAEVLFVTLDDADPDLLQRYDTPLDGVMASDYDADSGELTVLCDETCGGASVVLADTEGGFAPVTGTLNARPEGMDDVGNEGYAHVTTSDGTERYLWTDDSDTDGVSLRGAVG
jgi:hypothetical protein